MHASYLFIWFLNIFYGTDQLSIYFNQTFVLKTEKTEAFTVGTAYLPTCSWGGDRGYTLSSFHKLKSIWLIVNWVNVNALQKNCYNAQVENLETTSSPANLRNT